MSVEVRVARADDWPAVSSLLAELGRPDIRGTAHEEDHRRAFESYLTRTDALALAGVLDGAVAGLCDLEFRQRLNHLSPEAWIPDLVVLESARSHGVGAALLARAAEIAMERGAHAMILESAHWRKRAHAFYQREGWLDTGLTFARMPDGSPVPRNPKHR